MKNFWIAIKFTLTMCILLTVCYVAILRLTAAAIAPNGGEAVVVSVDGRTIGAQQVGQVFTDVRYFWGRPSAVEYNGGASGGSNKATTNPEYLAQVEERITAFLVAHPYLSRAEVPAELVTASGSGLDPHISPSGAEVQVRRVAQARGMTEAQVLHIVAATTERPWLGWFGTPTVHVLKLNVALDAAQRP